MITVLFCEGGGVLSYFIFDGLVVCDSFVHYLGLLVRSRVLARISP